MKLRTATVLRAHLLLVSLSANAAAIAYMTAGSLLGLFSDGELPYLDSIAALTLVIMILLRRYAQHAFDSALDAQKVRLGGATRHASVDLDCPRLLFVQLHLRLQGLRCEE